MDNGKYDCLDLEKENNKCHDNCIGKQACLQLVKDGKNRTLNDIEREIFALYPDFNAVANDILLIIASMRVE